MTKEKPRVQDEAGTGPDPRLSRHLMPLREAKRYRVAKGDSDIRGWSVFTSNGREVGRVGDLLVDTSIGEVVMFDVNRGDTGDQTITPIRAAWIDRGTKRVIVDNAQLAPTSELPAVDRTPTAPPAAATTPVDEGVAREPLGEGQGLVRDDRERRRADDVIANRRYADSDEPAPLPETPRLEPRSSEDRPDTPR